MKQRNFIYKKLLCLILAAVMICSVAGCGKQEKSVKDQVTENLLNAGQNESEQGEIVLPPVKEPIPEAESVAEDTASEQKKEEKPQETVKEEPAESLDEKVEVNLEMPDENAKTEEEKLEDEDDTKLQIVFMGDSIFDNARDGSGVPYLTGEKLDANIYNLAIGGTPAGLYRDEDATYEKWNSIGMLGMIHAACGDISPDIFNGFYARKVFDKIDFSKTDYFVVEYGTNDFLSGIPISNDTDETYNPYCYYGAVEIGVQKLKSEFPNAEVIFCTPHFEQFWAGTGRWLGDSNTYNKGYGTLYDYTAAGLNAAEHAGAHIVDGYSELGIDAYTAEDYLEDGIHLTEEGRKQYAKILAKRIKKIEMNKAN